MEQNMGGNREMRCKTQGNLGKDACSSETRKRGVEGWQ